MPLGEKEASLLGVKHILECCLNKTDEQKTKQLFKTYLIHHGTKKTHPDSTLFVWWNAVKMDDELPMTKICMTLEGNIPNIVST